MFDGHYNTVNKSLYSSTSLFDVGSDSCSMINCTLKEADTYGVWIRKSNSILIQGCKIFGQVNTCSDNPAIFWFRVVMD